VNDIALLQASGPEAPPLRPEAVHAARAALLAEIEESRTPRRRFRAPSRKTSLRVGLAAVTAAAAWTAAVVIAGPDTPSGPPPTSVTLVAFEPPTFPLSLEPVPAGMTPSFSQDPGKVQHAGYRAADGHDWISLTVTPEEPESYGVTDVDDQEVDGRDAEIRHAHDTYCDTAGKNCRDELNLELIWERRDGQWVRITGGGRYDGADRLVSVAESLVDEPQAVPLQVHLAPAGWSVFAYKDDTILTLADDRFPDQTMNVHLPESAIPAAELPTQLEQVAGPVQEVTVNGQPAQLVPTGYGWYLEARFPDGTVFALQTPQAFTADDVLAVAGGITYTPPAG
jgi:hypothetical protein